MPRDRVVLAHEEGKGSDEDGALRRRARLEVERALARDEREAAAAREWNKRRRVVLCMHSMYDRHPYGRNAALHSDALDAVRGDEAPSHLEAE